MTVYFLFKVRTACSECGEPLMLDGPLRSIRCLACQSLLEIDPRSWKRIMEFREEDSVRKKVASTMLGFASVFTFHLRMGPQSPRCTACDHPLDVSAVTPGMDGEIPCPCGQTMPTFPAPAWLREVHPLAVQLFNAAREDVADNAPVTPQTNRPVSFGCPDCGANLKVTMDSPRILECQYCKTDLFLPDPLWRALHPVRKRSAWYVGFTPGRIKHDNAGS
jgi:DNA-directed RNA polymerase subunit RPC12/RpoP